MSVLHLTLEATKNIVQAIMTYHFEPGNGLLCGIRANCVAKLQCVQSNATKMIVEGRQFDIADILEELHWLPFAQGIKFKVVLFAFKCVCGLAPAYLSERLIPFVPSHTL